MFGNRSESNEFIPASERQRIIFDKLEKMDLLHRHELQEVLLRQTHQQQSLQRRLFLEHYDNLEERPVIGFERFIFKLPRQVLLLEYNEELEEQFESDVLTLKQVHDSDLKKMTDLHKAELEQKTQDQLQEMQDVDLKHEVQYNDMVKNQCQEFLSELQRLHRQQQRELEVKHQVELRELKSAQIGREFQLKRSFELHVRNLKSRLEKALNEVPPLEPVILMDPRCFLSVRREARERKRIMEQQRQEAEEAEQADDPPADTADTANSDEVEDDEQKSNAEAHDSEEPGCSNKIELEREKKLERERVLARQLEQELAEKRARELARSLACERQRLREERIKSAQLEMEQNQALAQQGDEGQEPSQQPVHDGEYSHLDFQDANLEADAQEPEYNYEEIPEELEEQVHAMVPAQHFSQLNAAAAATVTYHQQQQQQQPQFQQQSFMFPTQVTQYHSHSHGHNQYRLVGYNNQMPQTNQYPRSEVYPRSNFKNFYSMPYQQDKSGPDASASVGDQNVEQQQQPHNANANTNASTSSSSLQVMTPVHGPQFFSAPPLMMQPTLYRTTGQQYQNRQQNWSMRQQQNASQQQQQQPIRQSNRSNGSSGSGASSTATSHHNRHNQHSHHNQQQPTQNPLNYTRRSQNTNRDNSLSSSSSPLYSERRQTIPKNATEPVRATINKPPNTTESANVAQLDQVHVEEEENKPELAANSVGTNISDNGDNENATGTKAKNEFRKMDKKQTENETENEVESKSEDVVTGESEPEGELVIIVENPVINYLNIPPPIAGEIKTETVTDNAVDGELKCETETETEFEPDTLTAELESDGDSEISEIE